MDDNKKDDFLSRRGFVKSLALGLSVGPTLSFANLTNQQFIINEGKNLLTDSLSSYKGLKLMDKGDGLYHASGNGLPNHSTGFFPNANCPLEILPQNFNFKITKTPEVKKTTTPLNGWLFGVCVNGVVLDPSGPFFRGQSSLGLQFEVMSGRARPFLGLDLNNAHVQPSGEYHYHGLPVGLIQGLTEIQKKHKMKPRMILVGWAADGFPIYAPYAHQNAMDLNSPLIEVTSGYIVSASTLSARPRQGVVEAGTFVQDYLYVKNKSPLDELNGRFGVTPEFPKGIYHYFLTQDFPHILRAWRGTPDKSFFHPDPANLGIEIVPMGLRNIG